MSGTAVALVLTSAFLHALWNARVHTGGDRVMELVVAYATGSLLLAPWLIADPPTEVLGWVLLSGIAHGGYIWGLATAYSRGGLATTYPLARGTAPLLVAVVGVWLLDQTPSGFTVAGALTVAAGLTVVGGVAWGRRERAAVAAALMTGGFIASYTLLDARGVSATGELGYYAGASSVAVVLVVVGQRAGIGRIRPALGAGFRVGVASTSAYALVLLAYNRADAANVATLRGTSILFGLALVPRTVTPRLVTGAIAVMAGAALVTL